MIRKKRYLAAKMGLLALGLMLLFPGQAEAADKKTIYNSLTYRSARRKAFTTCAGTRIIHGMRRMTVPLYIPA